MNLQALDLMLGQKGTVNPKELSPLALAYIGDAVYEMLVRTTVLTGGNAPVNRLHKTARDMVNAKAQAEFYFRVAEELTEEETAVPQRTQREILHHTEERRFDGLPPCNGGRSGIRLSVSGWKSAGAVVGLFGRNS